MSAEKSFTKENLEHYLLELSREFRKLNGRKMPAEIIIIGGGAVLLKYNFRSSTGDVDAIVQFIFGYAGGDKYCWRKISSAKRLA